MLQTAIEVNPTFAYTSKLKKHMKTKKVISGLAAALLITAGSTINSAAQWNIPVNGNAVTGTGQNSFIGFGTSKYDLLFKTDNTTRMLISNQVATKGNVGINVSSPLQKLHLNGTMLIDGQGGSLSFGEETSGSYLWGEYNIEYWDGTGVPDAEKGLNFAKPHGSHNGAGNIAGLKNFVLFMNNEGTVGIGAEPSAIDNTYKLNVCGGIRAKHIVVNSTWCDFVFNDDYKLKPLEEVESFINENNHLPEIPAAAAIESNGADLGNLVRLQMMKIEELTLYSIEQNKRIKELESKINVK